VIAPRRRLAKTWIYCGLSGRNPSKLLQSMV
jgi:hypothetical protein